jgi:hypothetical protein
MQFVLYYGSSNAGFYQYGEGTGKWEQLSITYTSGGGSINSAFLMLLGT